MLLEHEISGMPVCDDSGTVLGVVSEGDILFKERGRPDSRGGFIGWLLGSRPERESEKALARTAGEAMSSPPITAASVRVVCRSRATHDGGGDQPASDRRDGRSPGRNPHA